MPTVLYLQCYGKDKLSAVNRNAIDAANRFGMVIAYLSTPGGAWSWNTSVVNDQHPRPCTAAAAGQDYTYVSDALSFLSAQTYFDSSRVYTSGFSQNGMASAFVGRCFEEKVTGQWMGGGGLFSPGEGPVPPNKAGTCDKCKYWPVFPCHSSKHGVQACIQFYSNDPITVDQHDPADGPRTKGHGLYLFDRLQTEGNDGRMMMFAPNSAQGITGGHRAPQNMWDWFVGCFGGITPMCSAQCEDALTECMNSYTKAGYYYSWWSYNTCLTSDLVKSGKCAAGCTPTYKMLASSEAPTLNLTTNTKWGQKAAPHPRLHKHLLCLAVYATGRCRGVFTCGMTQHYPT